MEKKHGGLLHLTTWDIKQVAHLLEQAVQSSGSQVPLPSHTMRSSPSTLLAAIA